MNETRVTRFCSVWDLFGNLACVGSAWKCRKLFRDSVLCGSACRVQKAEAHVYHALNQLLWPKENDGCANHGLCFCGAWRTQSGDVFGVFGIRAISLARRRNLAVVQAGDVSETLKRHRLERPPDFCAIDFPPSPEVRRIPVVSVSPTNLECPVGVRAVNLTRCGSLAAVQVGDVSETLLAVKRPTVCKCQRPTLSKFDAPTLCKFKRPTVCKCKRPTPFKFDTPALGTFNAPTFCKFNTPAVCKFNAPAGRHGGAALRGGAAGLDWGDSSSR